MGEEPIVVEAAVIFGQKVCRVERGSIPISVWGISLRILEQLVLILKFRSLERSFKKRTA